MTLNHPSIVSALPEWVPAQDTETVPAGEYFDVVRIGGLRALDVALALAAVTDGHPGGIVDEDDGGQLLSFLTPPRSVRALRWPPGVVVRDGRSTGSVRIPALAVRAGGVRWWSPPSERTRLVDVVKLHGILLGQLSDALDPEYWLSAPDVDG